MTTVQQSPVFVLTRPDLRHTASLGHDDKRLNADTNLRLVSSWNRSAAANHPTYIALGSLSFDTAATASSSDLPLFAEQPHSVPPQPPQSPATSALLLRVQACYMAPSSTGDSPRSASGTGTATVARGFPLPSRDFSIEVPPPMAASSTNGASTIKSPNSVKSQRAPSFSREGILGAAQKARNLSQSSDNRPEPAPNGMQKLEAPTSDEGSNPLKRRNTDAGVDYPRRRATIAVCAWSISFPFFI